MESDEALTRRLQAQEMGMSTSRVTDNTPFIQSTSYSNDNGPLNRLDTQNRGPDLNSNGRSPDFSTSRATVFAILAVHVPQIIASIAVLSIHWRDRVPVCDASHETKWRVWATFSAIRMTVYSILILFMFLFKRFLNDRPRWAHQVFNFRNMIDALGVIWLVVGNILLFCDDDNSCKHPEKSPIYGLCISILIINYLYVCPLCLPSILVALMNPAVYLFFILSILFILFCFCGTCSIQIIEHGINNRAVQSATSAAIDLIPIGPDVSTTLQSEDLSCPICLNDMVTGDEVRLLQCSHNFHRQCVDEWLRVNASCPICRQSVLRESTEIPTNSGGQLVTINGS